MATTRFILVRHGETTWNKEGRYQGQIDTPLTPFGRQQGQLAAAALKDVPIDACYASPLSRAVDTAMMCVAAHGLPVNTDNRLLEINHGEWEGLLSDEVGKTYPELLVQWKTTVVGVTMPGPGGEDITAVRDRAMAAFRELAAKHQGQTVLVVAHDAVNKAVLCDILDIDLTHFWQIKQDNTCINVFEYQDGKWRLVLMNSTTHLGFLYSGIEQKGL
ncbi:histidine phosphatase family protein [Sporomusa acidovorans]|uniref:Phosphoserine phosphatase 1 n=1 Tax=Sporomusa acidovorans (strain ATCC 49682 / DSM 3132 / Mol) TaxID=1123286 RepID=A0ABZ3JAT2_SPOA4|nr:histidine phosphatase family protein [Sporomusa acidovorans]OZC21670.1 phosphoserine phosphatase 1 [Sporomusa acidovorans DSM 3132]SDD60552.1 probable phosphoglycerate mutase [Sporomusa acidovorans]